VSGHTPPRGGPIDWSLVHARLKRAEEAVQQALDPSPERAQAIMQARAQALARVPPAPPGDTLDVVRFALGREHYAIETRFVREVVRLADFTPVPGTPDFIVGVTNLRGTILAVVDLHRFFGIDERGVTDLSRVLVLGIERAEIGILANDTHGQADLATADIHDQPANAPGSRRTHLRGVTGEALAVLDGATLLADPRLVIGNERE